LAKPLLNNVRTFAADLIAELFFKLV